MASAPKNGKNGKTASKPQPEDVDEAAFLQQMQQDAGKGMEDVRPDDLGLPWFRLLQKLSPEVDRGNASYVTGARDGLWFDSIGRGLYESLIVLPAKYIMHYVEWTPRDAGGGFVRNYGGDPEAYDQARAAGKGGFKAVTRDGTEIIPTGTWFCLVLSGRREGAKEDTVLNKRGVFSFYSTGQRISRQWAGEANALTMTGPDGRVFQPPLFAHTWRLGAAPTKNASGSWMLPTVVKEQWVKDLGPNWMSIYENAREYATFAGEYHHKLTYPRMAQIESSAPSDTQQQREPGEDRDADDETPF